MKKFLPEATSEFIKSIFRKVESTKFASCFLFVSLGQILYVLLPGLLGILIDNVYVNDRWTISWLLLFPLTWFFSLIFSSLGKFYSSTITQDVRKASKELVFHHIISLPNSLYTSRGAGEFENLMHEISFSTRYMFCENFPFFIRTALSIIIALVTIWISSLELALLFLAWACIYVPISYVSAKRSMRNVADSLSSSADVSASTVDVIENHELIPAFGTETFEISRFNHILDKERSSYISAQRAIDRADFFQRFLQVTLPLALVFALVFARETISLTPGAIASLLSIILVITTQIGDLGKGILSFFEVEARLKAALDKISCPSPMQQNTVKPVMYEPEKWDIHFQNVGFSYDNNNDGIKNLSLTIPDNLKVGIIGYSGAGKTTLIKLLRGFCKPNHGEIYIGGINLSSIHPKALTQNIAEVSQAIPLFHRSIRENVAYGCDGFSDDKIWHILEKAQMASCVKKLPYGLDTIIGVRGQKLSGGERARLGIARAFLRNAKIIILDEATSAIDSESELLIQEALSELLKGRTVIAIAHRLSTLRAMEQILVLDKGQIVAQGSHKTLLESSDLYNRLWNTQILI